MFLWRALLLLLAIATPSGTALARQGVATVEVAGVRFGVVPDSAGAVWWCGEVELRIEAGLGGDRARFAERVRVELQWGAEVAGAEEGFEFYRAAAVAAAVEAGTAVYRFYLPPAVVRRDRIESAPRFWSAVVSAAGIQLPDSRRSVGPGLSSPESLENFRRRLGARAPANDGVLLPWYLTPFALPARADAPVPIRLEASAGPF